MWLANCRGGHRPPLQKKLFAGRSAEFCGVDRDVRFHVFDLGGVSSVKPGELIFERELDATNIPVIGIVDLDRRASDR